MAHDEWIAQRADHRAVATQASSPTALAELTSDWPIPSGLPPTAARRWDRALAQFRSGSIAYENFTDAVRNGFEAVDSALRHRIQDLLPSGEVVTFGKLVARANDAGRLTPRQHEWLSRYAVRLRNRLTHADLGEPLVLTPPMAAEMLAGIARFLIDLMAPVEQLERGSQSG